MEDILQDLNPQKSKTAYDKAWADFVQHCGIVNQPQEELFMQYGPEIGRAHV